MNSSHIPALALSLALAVSGICQEAAPKAQPAPAAPPEDETLRDPFWPVGFVNTNAVAPITPATNKTSTASDGGTSTGRTATVTVTPPPVTPPDANVVKWPTPMIKAVTKTKSGFLVSIEGVGVFSEGDIVPVRSGNILYKFKLESIGAKGVSLKKLDATPYKR